MPINTFPFQPLQHRHYTLAETQDEKDAEASRKIAQINAQGANQLAEAGVRANSQLLSDQMQLGEGARRFDIAQQVITKDADRKDQQYQDALDQQQFENGLKEKAFGLQAQNMAEDNRRAETQLGLQQAQNKREQEAFDMKLHDYRAMQPFQAKTLAYAQIGSILDSLDVDEKTGEADATKFKDQIANIYGVSGKDFDNITVKANPNNGMFQFYGYNKKAGTTGILTTKDGSPLPFNYRDIQAAQQFFKPQVKQPEEKFINLERQVANADGSTTKLSGQFGLTSGNFYSLDENGNLKTTRPSGNPEQDVKNHAASIQPQVNTGTIPQQGMGLQRPSLQKAVENEKDPSKLLDILAPYLTVEDSEALNALPADQARAKLFRIRNRMILNNEIR